MLGHVSIRVANREESAKFYLEALSPLAYTAMHFPGVTGIGPSDSSVPIPNLWLRQVTPSTDGTDSKKPTPIHISFYVEERRLVDEFYSKALAAGGKDNGPPGVRLFFPNYYGMRISTHDWK